MHIHLPHGATASNEGRPFLSGTVHAYASDVQHSICLGCPEGPRHYHYQDARAKGGQSDSANDANERSFPSVVLYLQPASNCEGSAPETVTPRAPQSGSVGFMKTMPMRIASARSQS